MITISEVARLAGTTPRAVRLYHQRGLLPEPPRAPNGYRSYGPDDLLALLRIRRLRELGLPLTRIAELTSGPPESLRGGLATLDAELARLQQEIAARRAAIAAVLEMPGDITLPPPLAALFEAARGAGYSERAIAEERDAVLITLAAEPGALPALVEFYAAAITDAAGTIGAATAAYEALDGAAEDDQRVEAVARDLAAAIGAVVAGLEEPADAVGSPGFTPEAERLLERFWTDRCSPAQMRVNALVDAALRERFAP